MKRTLINILLAPPIIIALVLVCWFMVYAVINEPKIVFSQLGLFWVFGAVIYFAEGKHKK